MRHRVGSITKTFTAAAVLQQVETGQIGLDTPIGHYLPRLVPGDRGEAITVRMLINHTSGLAEYLPYAYPSLKAFPSLGEHDAREPGRPQADAVPPDRADRDGGRSAGCRYPRRHPGMYSNTNYLLLCQLLERLTGTPAEKCITQNVIERAGLRDTELPAGPYVNGPHSRIYEAWFGMIDPPRDYSVYDMSWVGPAASLISTVADLNHFFGMLLAGEIVNQSSLAQMQRTVPVISFEGKRIDYGLGLHRRTVPGRGTFWGHDGSTWGAGAISMTSADGKRQMSVAVNLQRWNPLDSAGRPQPHPIDHALAVLYQAAMGGS